MTTLQIRGKGTITLPAKLRKKYNLEEGEVLTIIDLGGGSFLLRPKTLGIDKLSQEIEKKVKEENISLDELVDTLQTERKRIFKELYGDIKKKNGQN